MLGGGINASAPQRVAEVAPTGEAGPSKTWVEKAKSDIYHLECGGSITFHGLAKRFGNSKECWKISYF